jgi:hypothetical protein
LLPNPVNRAKFSTIPFAFHLLTLLYFSSARGLDVGLQFFCPSC